MKKYALALFGVVAVVAVAAAIVISSNSVDYLNVNDVASDPGGYAGKIGVTGVMAVFAQNDQTIFGIMDKKELSCNNPNCGRVYLPVRYAGQLPKIGDEVKVQGSFALENGGYILTAEEVKVVANHKLGG